MVFVLGSYRFAVADNFQVVTKQNKVGLIDAQGNQIIPAKYDQLGWSEKNVTLVTPNSLIGYQEAGLWGVLNLKDVKIVPAKFNSIYPVGQKGLLLASYRDKFSLQQKYGLLNDKGKVSVDFRFVNLWALDEKDHYLARQEIGSDVFYGIIDDHGRALLPFQYPNIQKLGDDRLVVKNTDGEVALATFEGKLLTNFAFDSLKLSVGPALVAYKNGAVGLLTKEGTVTVPVEKKSIQWELDHWKMEPFADLTLLSDQNKVQKKYMGDSLSPISETRAILHRNNADQVVSNGSMSSSIVYPHLVPVNSNLLVARKQDKLALVTVEGEQLTRFRFDSVFVKEDFVVLSRNKNSISIFSATGVKLSASYKGLKILNNGMWAFQQGKYWGVTDSTNKPVIYARYDDVIEVHQGQFLVKYLNKFGVINSKEEWIVRPRPTPIQWAHGMWFSKDQFGSKLTNTNGDEVYFTFNALTTHPLGFIERGNNQKIGLIDTAGRKTFFVDYDSLVDLTHGKYAIYRGGLAALLDDNGKVVIPFSRGVHHYATFGEDFIGAKLDDQYGFIDMHGTLRLANRYDHAGAYMQDRAPVNIKGGWGFMNRKEEIVLQPNYDAVKPYENGLAMVQKDGLWGVVDLNGQELVKPLYPEMERMNTGGFLVKLNGKYGYINNKGSLRLTPKFDLIKPLTSNRLLTCRRGKYGVISSGGLDVIPMIYQGIRYDARSKQFIARQQRSFLWKKP